MNTKLPLSIFACLLALALGRPAPGRAEARPSLPPEAAKVAQEFVTAFSRNDRGTIAKLLPKQLRNLYGPSPFSRVPTLTKPRADKRMGVIEFQGGGGDKALPDRGMIMLRRVTEGKHTVWRIRQIYWYDELPRDARVPQDSLTAADKREEPRITEAAREFLRTWIAQDYEKLNGQVFHWWEISREAPKWVKLNRVVLRDTDDSMGGRRVDFTAKLRLLGALSRDVDGTLWLVHEDGQWRVRPLTVAFVF